MHSERFHETQRFRQTWMWIVLVLCIMPSVVITFIGVWQQGVMGKPFGDHPTSDAGLVMAFLATVLIGGGAIVLIAASRLDVGVNDDAVTIRFRPFHRKGRSIPLHDIREARMRVYRPILEYGGWGIRMGFSGKAYNVSGNEGVQLELADGSRILIGSQRSRELEAAITSSRNRPR